MEYHKTKMCHAISGYQDCIWWFKRFWNKGKLLGWLKNSNSNTWNLAYLGNKWMVGRKKMRPNTFIEILQLLHFLLWHDFSLIFFLFQRGWRGDGIAHGRYGTGFLSVRIYIFLLFIISYYYLSLLFSRCVAGAAGHQ